MVALLKDMNHGNVRNIPDEKKKAIEPFKGLLNTEKGQFIMVGHSFGAATTVAACKDKENAAGDYPLKDEFRAAIMLDIWMMVM